jgi:hypothetical protein
MNKFKRPSQIKKSLLLLVSCAVLTLGYNNCSKGFEVQQGELSVGSNGGAGSDDPGTGSGGGGVIGEGMPTGFSANSLKVCPSGCTFTMPSQAIAVAKDGDVIEIMTGSYKDCMDVRQSRLTIRGVGTARPNLHSVLCSDKGLITNNGVQNRIENLEISDFHNTSQNGAAIRQDGSGKELILSNLDIHDGQMGLLGGSSGDHIYVNETKFYRVGLLRDDGEISLPIFTTAGALLQIRKSSFMEPVGTASLIKVRSEVLTIDCSTLANLEEPDSYTIDYQTGGKLVITNSVLEQSQTTVNTTMVAINSVSYNAGIENSISLSGNLFLNDAQKGTFIKMFNTPSNPITATDNTFVGSGTLFSNNFQPGASNKLLADRSAEMGAYPKLPAPGACKTAAPKF